MELNAAITADPVAAARDSGSEAPPRPTSNNNNKPMGFLSYANGALKRHYPTAPANPLPPPPVFYKECMRNHAASMGGYATDGCCEFMPPATTLSPSDLRCAACGCHRNFHRRDPVPPHPVMAGLNIPSPATAANCGGRKRFRTKFSEEQKGKMRGFCERFGWKMQKTDRGAVEEFCKEVGVGREVLKVWMHNHKNTHTTTTTTVVHGGGDHNGVIGAQFEHSPAGDNLQVSSSRDGSSSSSSSGFSL